MMSPCRSVVAITALAMLSCGALLLAQAAGRSQGSTIAGTVVDGSSRAPIVAIVTLRAARSSMAPRRQTTDAKGRFEFASLAAGTYDIRVDREGYFPGAYGVERPLDQAPGLLELRQSDRRDLTIAMWRYSSISGEVYDTRNEPVAGASVQALRRTESGWERAGAPARTDDRGAFVVRPLLPGEYMAVLLRSTQSASGAGGMFYPAAPDLAGAMTIRVEPAEERSGLLFVRDSQSARGGFGLSGRVTGAPEALILYLTPVGAGDALGDFQRLETPVAPDGRFSFASLPPGGYRLEAWKFPDVARDTLTVDSSRSGLVLGGLPDSDRPLAALPSDPTWVVDTEVVVTGNVSDLTIEARRGARIRGRVEFRGSSRPEQGALARLPIIIRPARNRNLGKVPQARVEKDGTFQSVGLPAGEYAIGVRPALTLPDLGDLALISVRLGGSEYIGQPIALGESDVDLVLGMATGLPEIRGTVTDASGRPHARARILVYPQQKSRWETWLPQPAPTWTVHTTADESGVFAIRVLPGQYFVAARQALPDFWRTADFIGGLASPHPISVNLGDRKTLSITSEVRR